MKSKIIILVVMAAGCSTPAVRQEFSFSKSPNEAYDCALFAARDIGLSIGMSDATSGIFSATKTENNLGGLLGMSAQEVQFAVDKKLKTVQVSVNSYNQLTPDVAKTQSMIADFQASFKKRCA